MDSELYLVRKKSILSWALRKNPVKWDSIAFYAKSESRKSDILFPYLDVFQLIDWILTFQRNIITFEAIAILLTLSYIHVD